MTALDILDAVNRRLVQRWPKRTVYVDVCPVDFDRPSFWLAVEENVQTDASRACVRRQLRLKLTLHDQLDEHYEASWRRLAQETEEVMKLLTPPLAVGKRRLGLELKGLPREPDRACVQIGCSWLERRPEPDGSAGSAPPAEHYGVRVEARP